MSAYRNMDYMGLLALVRQGELRARAHSGSVRSTDPYASAAWSSFIRPDQRVEDQAGGDIFVALPALPGHEGSGGEGFIRSAVANGASVILIRPELLAELPQILDGLETAIIVVEHPSPRAALGELAAAEFGNGGSFPRLIGITGTNGKTTSAYLLETILTECPFVKAGVIGTVEYRWPGHRENAPLTTPGCLELHTLIRKMREAGTGAAIMEISSHALDQDRVAGLEFDGALFTNLTQDHLDYHQDMENYFQAKARLFRSGEKGGFPGAAKAMAINVDDPYGLRLYAECARTSRQIAYGFDHSQADSANFLQGRILEQSRAGLRLVMRYQQQEWELQSPLVGRFNAYNLLGAQAMALALGCGPERFAALEHFSGVPGRLERISADKDFSIFVDYAHTPDALEKALSALRGAGFEHIVTVFGCGGDRDRAKRPLMGRAAAALSNAVVLTSDNPRGEDPGVIMAEVLPGLVSCPQVFAEPDRREAIALGISLLQSGSALLIAGKGHEDYQIIGKVRYPFSDSRVVRELLSCA